MNATSGYLNHEPRNLSEVLREREHRLAVQATDARWRWQYHMENLRDAERMGSRMLAFRSLDGLAVARRQLALAKLGFCHARTSPIWKPRPSQRMRLWDDGPKMAAE